jgi:uncharacterized SAM-binding protein YcdF (DUF218 family)
VSRGLSPDAPGERRLGTVATLGIAAGLGATLLVGLATVRIWDAGARDERRPAGAIVVLGAAQYDGRPSPVFAARIDHAVDLFHDGWAPYLVVTGGKQPGDRWTEAESARRYAVARGVPEAAILMEDRGRNTLESVRAVRGILAGQGIDDAIFVSDPTHMLRVIRMARDDGLAAWSSPTRTSPVERDLPSRLDATAHELAALAVYFVTRGA